MSKNINEYPLGSLYNIEIVHHAYYIIKWCEEIFDGYSQSDNESFYFSAGHIHNKIYTILTSAANISKMIKPNIKRKKINGRLESKKFQERRIERKDFYDILFDGIKITEIHKKQVRNTIEHFDEKLDKLSVNSFPYDVNNRTAGLYNFSISNLEMFKPFTKEHGGAAEELYPIKCYIADEKVFYNFGQKIDLQKIYDEANNIYNFLLENCFEEDYQVGGALLMDF